MSITETKKPDLGYSQISYLKDYKDVKVEKTTKLDQKVKARYSLFCKIAEKGYTDPHYNPYLGLNLYKRLTCLSGTACELSKAIPEDILDLAPPENEKKFRKMMKVVRSIALWFKEIVKSQAAKSEEREIKYEEREIREIVKYGENPFLLKMDEMELSEELSTIISLMDEYIDGNYQEAKIYQSRKRALEKGETLSGQSLSELHKDQTRVDLKSEIEWRVSRFTKRIKRQSERDERLIELYMRRSARSLKPLPTEKGFEKFLKNEVDLARRRQYLILPQLERVSSSFKENEKCTLERLEVLDAKLASLSKKYLDKKDRRLNRLYGQAVTFSMKGDRPGLELIFERSLSSETSRRLRAEIKAFS